MMLDLLQVAIGVKDGNLLMVSPEDWKEFFLFCKRQALLGVGFSAVEEIGSCPKELVLSWYGIVVQIEKRNQMMTKACGEITEKFAEDGFDTCVLKGQGNLINYPEHLKNRRQPGDIDLWASPKDGGNVQGKVIEYVRSLGHTQVGPNYLHIDTVWKGNIEVEVHYRPRFLVSPYRNYLVQKWFRRSRAVCMSNRIAEGFFVPTNSVNVVYQMAHLFSHYFDEGLGLRQLLDYIWVLKNLNIEILKDNRNIKILQRDLKHLGLWKFAGAVMWVLQKVFAMSDEYLLCPPDEKEGRKLLGEMMQSGNFGQFDERGASMKNGGMLKHGLWKLYRIMRLVNSYPEMALCEPFFRTWHFFWRISHRSH